MEECSDAVAWSRKQISKQVLVEDGMEECVLTGRRQQVHPALRVWLRKCECKGGRCL